ncbi:MAG: response regulator [Deltaproteobacteria bacterium]|nr:response regulator [Deltaproteobacteria bacterium]MBW2145094.1 response regulator [Deltaproteobacteria bacterium]
MKEKFTILITDRNRHVRDFLRREMMGEGFKIRMAKNAREVLEWVYHRDLVDLLILDPDLPNAGERAMMERLNDRIPPLPVVVHSFLSDNETYLDCLHPAAFVEKRGNSIERLKEVVFEILGNPEHQSANASEESAKSLRKTIQGEKNIGNHS